MHVEEAVAALVVPVAEDHGLTLVQAKRTQGVMQLMVEQADGSSPTLEQCAKLSREVSALLDVEEVIPGAYQLEVTSPGVNRPLLSKADYDRFKGRTAKVKLSGKVNESNVWVGAIVTATDDEVTLQCEEETVVVPLSMVKDAQLEFGKAEMAQVLKGGK